MTFRGFDLYYIVYGLGVLHTRLLGYSAFKAVFSNINKNIRKYDFHKSFIWEITRENNSYS